MKFTSLDDFLEGKTGLSVAYIVALLESEEGRPIYFRNTVVGKIYDTTFGRLYITKRTRETFFRKYGSFGITKDILMKLKASNVEKIVIYCHDCGDAPAAWVAPLSDWLEKGQYFFWDEIDDYQYHLPLDQMERLR